MFKNTVFLIFIPFIFTSCVSLAPKLELNQDKLLPENFSEYEQGTNTSIKFDEYIKDETLKSLVVLALENNKDIKIALLNIEASKNLYKIEDSKYFPNIDASSILTRSKNKDVIKNSYKANLSASFEFDLFGRIKSLNDSAKNSFLATTYALNSAKLSLISQTINSYLSLASNVENLNLAKQMSQNLQAVYELTNKKYQVGTSPKKDVLSSFASYKESLNEIIKYENLIKKDINSIELLTSSKFLEAMFPNSLKNSEDYIASIKPNLNSTTLLNRPDIKELEYKLKSKNANIGVARAAFFPTISLSASTGYTSLALNSLFDSQNSFWQFSPSINIPIFSAGENLAQLKYSKTKKEIALKEYEKGIQLAFKEIKDTLTSRENIFERLKNQEEITKSLETSYNIALNSYKIGYESYLNMLTYQKAYINSQKNLISLKLEEMENKVELYKILGGKIK